MSAAKCQRVATVPTVTAKAHSGCVSMLARASAALRCAGLARRCSEGSSCFARKSFGGFIRRARGRPRRAPVRFSLQRFDFGSFIFRDAWEAYKAAIPPAEHGDFIAAYYKRLTSDDPTVRAKAAAVRSRLRFAGAPSASSSGRQIAVGRRRGRVGR